MVNTMVSIAEAILDAPPQDPLAEAEIVATAERQLLMVALGVPEWRSAGAGAEVAAAAGAGAQPVPPRTR